MTLTTVAKTGVATVLASSVGLSAFASTEQYNIDPYHTAVQWRVNHFNFSKPSGKFMHIKGHINFDEDDVTNSSVKVTIPLAKVQSGVPKLDQHLKSKEFFNVSKYPNAIFESTELISKGDDHYKVIGNLTLHGVSKQISLNAHLNKVGKNFKKKPTIGFSGKTTIDRTNYGIDAYTPALSKDVDIDIQVEANLSE